MMQRLAYRGSVYYLTDTDGDGRRHLTKNRKHVAIFTRGDRGTTKEYTVRQDEGVAIQTGILRHNFDRLNVNAVAWRF